MQVSKYDVLVKILDEIRQEARGTRVEKKYIFSDDNEDFLQQARSRAYIHLYLKVMFGIVSFLERESFITEGSSDGGIDAYYIDSESRRIYFIQSKFRKNEKNFENKEIEPEEILVMDVDRVTSGHIENENRVKYNGHILSMIRKISDIPDIGRYAYVVVILANCSISKEKLYKITGGNKSEIFNFERSYSDLVFPVISGSYFKAKDVMIQVDLNRKSSGAKTSYSVETKSHYCEITVLFIPTIEVAKIMNRYRNTILEYNPRSYLELEGKIVNQSIRETLSQPNGNAFALMNNGITIISDETNINEKIGQSNKAQLHILRPQIINGGQTAYTLSRIYRENPAEAEIMLSGKEVLTKIITITPKVEAIDSDKERLLLIDDISAASNRQTPVFAVDKLSNDEIYRKLQKVLFLNYGIIFEKKRGEFSDGISAGYIDGKSIVDRNTFFIVFYVMLGNIPFARKRKLFLINDIEENELMDEHNLSKWMFCYRILRLLMKNNVDRKVVRMRDNILLCKVFLGISVADPEMSDDKIFECINNKWNEFTEIRKKITENYNINKKNGEESKRKKERGKLGGGGMVDQLRDFVGIS